MRFDWYQGTIRDDVQSVLLSFSGPDYVVRQDADGLAKSYLYARGFTVTNKQNCEQIKVLSDGKNGEHGTHFIASGDAAQAVAHMVRRQWPDDHHVTRADACQDLHGNGLFKGVVKASRQIARKYNLSAEFILDPCNQLAGATQYLGSKSSDYRGRAYQKGLQVRAQLVSTFRTENPKVDAEKFFEQLQYPMPDGSLVDARDVVRVEAQIRPRTKEGKKMLALADPESCFGFSPWLQDWASSVLAFEAEKLDIRGKKKTDFEHRCEWMVRQYHPAIREILDCYGVEGTAAFLEYLIEKHVPKK